MTLGAPSGGVDLSLLVFIGMYSRALNVQKWNIYEGFLSVGKCALFD